MSSFEDIKPFIGGMNSDDEDRIIPPGDYREAWNSRSGSSESDNVGALENIKGTTLIETLDSNNKVIGSCQDIENEAIIFFAFDKGLGTKLHRIYRYFTKLDDVELILEDTLLDFQDDHQYKINHANVVEDLLYWTDGYNPPRKINIPKAINYTQSQPEGYVSITRDAISVMKRTNYDPPQVTYVDDSNIIINMVSTKLFQFSTRFIYDDQEKSSLSHYSKIAYPNSVDPENIEKGDDNAIDVTFEIGDHVVNTIQLLVRDNAAGFWFVIASFERSKLLGPTFTYRFTNNERREPIPLKEATKPFDLVPIRAFSQEFVLNKRMVYANIIEGYNVLPISISTEWKAYKLPPNIFTFSIDGKYKSFKRGGAHQIGMKYSDEYARYNEVSVYLPVIDVPWYVDSDLDTTYFDVLDPWIRSMNQRLELEVTINHSPPSWATHWQLVMTKELRVAGYITFEWLGSNKVDNSTITLTDTIDFTIKAGDRIRIVADNTAQPSDINNTAVDVYEELSPGTVFDSEILTYDSGSGELKAKDDIFTIISALDTYLLEIYTPNQVGSENLYVELGINNPITGGFHEGSVQNQTGVQPAIEVITGADVYLYASTENFGDITRTIFPVNTLPNTDEFSYSGDIRNQLTGVTTIENSGFADPAHNGTFTIDSIRYDSFFQTTNIKVTVGLTGGSSVGADAITNYVTQAPFADFPSEHKDYYLFRDTNDYDYGRAVGPGEIENFKDDFIAKLRYSGVYFENTQVNGLSSFEFDDSVSLQEKHGSINKIIQVGYVLKCLQDFKNTSIYVGRTESIDAQGNEQLLLTDAVLGTIRPSEDDWGTIHPESVVKLDRLLFFYDHNKQQVIQDAANGMYPVSDYKMIKYFRDVAERFDGASQGVFNVYGGINRRHNEYFLSFVDDWPIERVPSETISYNYIKKRWKSFHDFQTIIAPEVIEGFAHFGNFFVTFYDGQVYLNDSSNVYGNFFGQQNDQSVKLISAPEPKKVKVYDWMAYQSNKQWSAPLIEIPATDFNPSGMLSRLIESKFQEKEGVNYAEFLMDMNDPNPKFLTQTQALMNGRNLRGHVMLLTLENSHTEETVLFLVNIASTLSEKS